MANRHLIQVILAAAFATSGGDAAEKNRYEFRGRVLQSDGKPFRKVLPVVFFQGSITPFTARTLADGKGEFRFKDLLPGMYTLIVAVPRAGEIRQTVEVGPSFADSKRRVETTILFERKPVLEDSHAVSARELSIPDKAHREYEKAQEYLGKRNVARAVEHLKAAVNIAPQFSAAWNNLGTIAYQSQKYVEAEQYFRTALEHDPDSYSPLVNLGGALLSQGRSKDSLPVNLEAVKTKPDDALAHSQLGQSYFLVGQMEEAEKHLKQAKALDARHFSFPQLVLAEIYGRNGNYAAAAQELEEFLSYHPDAGFAEKARKALETARARARAASATSR